MKSTTETIIGALRVLARDIKTEDGVINACLDEAAERLEQYHTAITMTLTENLHLADGNNCTLIDLKLAVAGKFSQWVKIDYTDQKTWPIEAKPCLLAWDSEFKQMASSPAQTWERLAMLVKLDDVEGNDDGECGWLWAECLSGDFEDFDPRPTHWMYAPEFEGDLTP